MDVPTGDNGHEGCECMEHSHAAGDVEDPSEQGLSFWDIILIHPSTTTSFRESTQKLPWVVTMEITFPSFSELSAQKPIFFNRIMLTCTLAK